MTDNHPAVQIIKEETARLRKVPREDVEIKTLDDPNVPHTIVFWSRARSQGGRPGSYIVGIVNHGKLLSGFESTAPIVAKELHYGAARTLSAASMARLLGWLEGRLEPTQTIVSNEQIQRLRPDWREFVYLPRDAVVNGQPALEYWVEGRGESPLWESRAVFGPDGSVSLSIKEIWDHLTPGH